MTFSIIHGPDFKRDDFGIGDQGGAVSSGKPLTQRRITAIINRASIVGKTEYNYDTYKIKLDYIKDKIANLDLPGTMIARKEAAIRHFETVGKIMDFVEKELDGLIEENFMYDPRYPDDEPRLVLNTRLEGKYEQKPLKTIADVTTYIQSHVGELFHIQENILGNDRIAHFNDLKQPEKQIPEYVKRAATAFIAASIDIFMDAENAGKLEDLFSTLQSSWPCIEGKTSGLIEFKIKYIPDDSGPVATHDKDQDLNLCIGREISAMIKKNPNLSEWKDFAPTIKQNLIGVTRPITKPVRQTTKTAGGEILNSWKFIPVLDNNSRQVVRPITEKDIDDLGEACLDVIFEG